jgi:hypothetical protein
MKKLIELSVEGAKIIDLCIEGDKLIEAGTAGVYNKAVKGVKVNKGRTTPRSPGLFFYSILPCRPRLPDEHLGEQHRRAFFPSGVRRSRALSPASNSRGALL